MEDLLLNNPATEEAQATRLALLNGKVCLWLTASCIPGMSPQMKGSVEWIKAQQVKVVACFETKQDKLYEVMEKDGLFDQAIFADMSSDSAVQNIVAAVAEAEVKVDVVFSPYEHCLPLVGGVTEVLLPEQGNKEESYVIARSKNLARDVTRKAGLATPRSGVCDTVEELNKVVASVGFPCIIKSSSGAGSCGVLRADTDEEAVKAFERIMEDLKSNCLLNWNPGCGPVNVLVEQCLIGKEFDVDMLVYNGEIKYSQVVSNWECIAPYYLETASQMPSLETEETNETITKYAFECVKAMGFRCGCFHVEVMNTAEGPILIEVNARQGGGPNQVFNLEMTGVNIFANYFMALAGIPINPPVKPITFAMADYAVTSPFTGVLVDNKYLDHVKAHPNTFSTQDFVVPGGKCTGLDTGMPVWLGQFVVRGDDPKHCESIVKELIEDINSKINVVSEEEYKKMTEGEEQTAPAEEEAVVKVVDETPEQDENTVNVNKQ